MRKALQIVILICCAAFAAGNRKKDANLVPLRTHSIYMPYIDQDLQNRWFDFGADTIVNTNKHVRLTYDRPSQMGWLWSRMPLTATNWQIDVEFKIDGSNPTLHGDGMAFWFTTTRAQPGPVFGAMDNFEGLGIFFDTYANTRQPHSFPYVMAMIGDGKTPYDLANDGKRNRAGGCEADIRSKPISTKARITFYKENYLELQLQYKTWDQWEPCFIISNVTLPKTYYLGFTALTGEVSDNHDIVSVSANSVVSVPITKMLRPDSPLYYTPGSAGWSGLVFFIKLVASIAFLGILVMVYRAYKNQSNKRF